MDNSDAGQLTLGMTPQAPPGVRGIQLDSAKYSPPSDVCHWRPCTAGVDGLGRGIEDGLKDLHRLSRGKAAAMVDPGVVASSRWREPCCWPKVTVMSTMHSLPHCSMVGQDNTIHESRQPSTACVLLAGVGAATGHSSPRGSGVGERFRKWYWAGGGAN
jgi:hypothetical protein